MGKGIELAKQINPEEAQLIDNLKDQLLIVFLKRLGGKVSIPVNEINYTQNDLFTMRIDENKIFNFEIINKGGN